MVIPVEYPFSQYWRKAYLIMGSENRRMVCLVNGKHDRKTISYARYLMSVKLGRILRDDEHVDHIDNNKLNDCIDNLQILSSKENIKKYQATLPHEIHGTSSMYHKGCRCDKCVEYSRNYSKQYRKSNHEKVFPSQIKNIEKICEYCHNVFYVNSGHRNIRFCSRQCATRARYAVPSTN